MNIEQIAQRYHNMQLKILEFIDDTKNPNESSFFIDLVNQISLQNRNELEILLNILLNLANYHHRSNFFFEKIEKIIKYFKNSIIQNFNSSDIAEIFQNNKRMILFLFNEKIIVINDFIVESHKFNTTFLIFQDIEQNYDFYFKNQKIFKAIMGNFGILFVEKIAKLIEKYEMLDRFVNSFSKDYDFQTEFSYRFLGKIDFIDIFPKFKSFVDKKIYNQKEIIIKYLFSISVYEFCNSKKEIKSKTDTFLYHYNMTKLTDEYKNNIIYKLMYSRFQSFAEDISNSTNDFSDNFHYKSIINDIDQIPSLYATFCAAILECLLCKKQYCSLKYSIFLKIHEFYMPKNMHIKDILESMIGSFINKLNKYAQDCHLYILKICQLTALFIDDIIEKILEFEFSYFLQDMIKLLKKYYLISLENSKISKESFLNGENDSNICELIRNDSIEDFIIYINQENIPLSGTIKQSVCETNLLLMNNEITLIEYAAFFGSIQIFQYLIMNGVELTQTLWQYAIHGRNAEIINILVENSIEPPNNSYGKCLIESIKCHHNEIADYIENNLYDNEKDEFNYHFISIKYFNFGYFPKTINIESYDVLLFFRKYSLALLDIICTENNIPNYKQKIEKYLFNMLDFCDREKNARNINDFINFLSIKNLFK